jgi:hypothetical protein
MSKRGFVLILALAAALLAPACAKKEPPRVGSEQWRREAYNRFVHIDYKARRLQYKLATIRRWQDAFESELAKTRVGGTADTAAAMSAALSLTGTQATQADLDAACDSLASLIQKIRDEVAIAQGLLAGNPTNADLTTSIERLVGLSDDLSEIEDEIISIKEGGGMLVLPPGCQDALDSIHALQATLTDLENKLNDRVNNPIGNP